MSNKKWKWVYVHAGSGYGSRTAWYQVIGGRLVLWDEGSHDNLADNSAVLDFEGMTLEEARYLMDVMNEENEAATRGHRDGCHLCHWSIEVEDADEPPDYLVYEEPKEAAVIRAALDLMHKRIGFGEFKEAVRDYEGK